MDYYRPFPTYPGYQPNRNWEQLSEDRVLEDLEYLQQMYPTYAKRYQVRVRDILNQMDYDGSMIYDQYPDKWQLDRLVHSIITILKNEERGMNPQQSDEMEDSKWMWIQELVTVLLYYEILTRRQRKENRRYF
ncbi:MAG: hypothetical protein IIW54_06235 [Lachnospiraceae bacterium]|nr:hypothetical protein [Lachnospiraceae bacterium]